MSETSVLPPVRPVFAVIGHPNKGKSSLVATLSQDERVRIAAEPGTTTSAVRYPLRVDGEVLYELVDTPGFQRARGVLAWLREQAESSSATAADRPALVARFCTEADHRDRYPDEVALLEPIVAGAGILYIVDGSVPFGSDYEAEMEILRWTGRPSLAIINTIGEPRFVTEWERALGQFFRVVRVLDAVHANFDKRLDVLRAFGELEESWRAPLQRAVRALEGDRARKRRDAAREISQLLIDATTLSVEQRVPKDGDPQRYRPELEERYRAELRRLEVRCRGAIESVYAFSELDLTEDPSGEGETERALLEADLFAERTWLVFGLRTRDLVTAGAAAGAATGGMLDAAVGGASFFAGTAIGGVVGGVLGWLGADRIGELEMLQQPLGGMLARYGPATGPNLGFVLLGRARLHHAVVSGRTHARRDRVDLSVEGAKVEGLLPQPDAASTRRIAATLRSPGATALSTLQSQIEPLLQPTDGA